MSRQVCVASSCADPEEHSTKPELFALTDAELGETVSGAGIAALDDRHIAAAWVDGDVKTAILTCGQ